MVARMGLSGESIGGATGTRSSSGLEVGFWASDKEADGDGSGSVMAVSVDCFSSLSSSWSFSSEMESCASALAARLSWWGPFDDGEVVGVLDVDTDISCCCCCCCCCFCG